MKAVDRFPRLCGWGIFFVGFGALIACDYALRIRDGDVKSGGLPEMLWFAVQWLLAVPSAGLIWRGTRTRQLRVAAFGELAVHVAVGFVLYLWISLSYLTEAGIDSL